MKTTAILFISLLSAVLTINQSCRADNNELTFSANGKFKIVQFTDTHIENGGEKDARTLKLMCDILDSEKPDLVIFTGDNIAGAADYKKMIDLCFQPVIDRNIKWAAVLGNHDQEPDHSRHDIMEYICTKPYTLSQMGPDSVSGYCNYYLTIKSTKNNSDQWVLYLFDSNSYPSQKNRGKYDWIHTDQVQWYSNISKLINTEAAENSKSVKALAFFHIPLVEYAKGFDNGNVLSGHKFERVCSAELNSGLFTTMLELGDVKATFCGHDHVNDYTTEYFGIKLCYGRATGYNTYGDDKLDKGARVIIIDEETGTFQTRVVESKL